MPEGVTIKKSVIMETDGKAQLLDYILVVSTLEGEALNAKIGDYIVSTGVPGERWPVRQDIFENTYERIDANKEYKNPVCRGCPSLGTACGTCEKCQDEMYGRSAG